METIEIPKNTKIKEFKCEDCIAYIKYIDGETSEISCPLCKRTYNIRQLDNNQSGVSCKLIV